MAVDSFNKTNSNQPRWMGIVLSLAGIYNLLWGVWVIFFPIASLQASGYPETPVYPQFWQCIGMMVGVFGIGYLIAARDVVRYWPLVFVGLLGKIFGPVGMLLNLIQGTLPLSAGRTVLFNDLLWWGPFLAILWYVFREYSLRRTDRSAVMPFETALQTFRDQHGRSLAELSTNQKTLVVFLRHGGCIFCREALKELGTQQSALINNETKLVIVHMETDGRAAELLKRFGLENVSHISDPHEALYQAFGIGLGKFHQLLGWRVLSRGFVVSILKGHGVNKVKGNVFRMPGTFLIQNGKILKSYDYRDASDRPDYEQFACSLPTQPVVES